MNAHGLGLERQLELPLRCQVQVFLCRVADLQTHRSLCCVEGEATHAASRSDYCGILTVTCCVSFRVVVINAQNLPAALRDATSTMRRFPRQGERSEKPGMQGLKS